MTINGKHICSYVMGICNPLKSNIMVRALDNILLFAYAS